MRYPSCWLLGALSLALAGSLCSGEPAPQPTPLDAVKELTKAGRYAEAEQSARKLLAETEAASGADSLDVAAVLDQLVIALWRTGKSGDPATVAQAERAVALKERGLSPEHPEVAASLLNLGILFEDRAEYDRARQVTERALSIREKAFGPDDPKVAACLNNLAGLVDEVDPGAARAMYERALAINEKAFGPDAPIVATSLHNLASQLRAAGEYATARSMYERALTIYEKHFGPGHPEVAGTLRALAQVHKSMGDYAAARPLTERALAIWEQTVGPEHPEVAGSLNNLAGLLQETGDFAAARPLLERALRIREKTHGPDHPEVATSLANLGNLLRSTGDYAAALPLQERALSIREKALGPDHPALTLSLMSLANLHSTMGNYAAARPLFERTLSIRERVGGPEHPDVAQALGNLANLLRDSGDPQAARPLYERALSIQERAFGPEHPKLATTLSNLGNVWGDSGDLVRARRAHERALSIRQKTLGPDHPEVAQELHDLAWLRLSGSADDRATALDQALEAERIAREHLKRTIRSLSEREALRYAAVRAAGLDLALTLARQGLDAASRRRVLDAVVLSRAVVLDEMAARHRAVSGAEDPRVERLAVTLTAARTRLANLIVRGAGNQAPEVYRKLLDEAQREKEQAERALAEASTGFALELSRGRLGLDAVATSLPPGSALVAFTLYPRAGSIMDSPVPSYLAFVLRAGERDPHIVDLGAAAAIDPLVARWKKEASSGADEARYREAGVALRKAMWDPLAPALGDAGRAFLVPDGVLNLVNVAALPGESAGYLIESGPLVHHVSAERDLVPLEGARRGAGLLALGAPSYDATPGGTAATYRGERASCGDFATVRFEPLPATGAETREIVELWQKRAPAIDLREAAASESAFKREARGKRVLHLATHGFFLGGDCGSALDPARGIGGLAPATTPRPQVVPSALGGENPLRLSGLALAGANRRQALGPGEEDGILTAEEIAALDLSGAEWAVLSACETGVGDVRAGEGVFGLRRAFQVAGAGTLIMSLWSVDDESTRAWMRELYQGRLERGLDTAEAMREASLALLAERRRAGSSTHPFYWGAFVAAGSWR